ncbi:hypothetical protein KZZ52_14220 [Dactylosporangium sp. AC04546]|uniref:hypothetical protein n=1 Tax=Dactylosporangium sp. AC04546 TaxID=2862460 RepID=UPI001EDF4B89|nr:hypothetical protein [Dactylosporangium sp. AC04546]WVK86477.1 hypothetical protein KZZ52_14220 [Dactylosporangium sp. AC04546]
MSIDLSPLPAPFWWILGGITSAFLLFVLLALLVALFARKKSTRKNAWKILRTLLRFLGTALREILDLLHAIFGKGGKR